MNKMLVMLRSSRTARRDAAQSRLAAARQQLGAAIALQQQCSGALQTAVAWQQDLVQGRGRAADAQWRLAMRPTFEALIEQRQAQLERAHHDVVLKQRLVDLQRDALALCERALIRTDELDRLSRDEARLAELLQEQAQDEDLAAGQRRGAVRAFA